MEVTSNSYDKKLTSWKVDYYKNRKWKRPMVLTEKRLLFCEEYLRNGLDAVAASKFAGIEGGKSLLKKPLIKKYIEERQGQIVEKITGPTDWKVAKLKEIIDTGKISAETVNTNHVLSAIAEINKIEGNYAPEKKAILHINQDPQEVYNLMERIKQKEAERGY